MTCRQILQALSRSASTPTLYTGVTPGCEATLLVGRQQSALARSTAECRRRGYDVRGLIHAGRFTTVQLVSRPSVRAFNEDGEPVWRTDTDPREVDETDKMVRNISCYALLAMLTSHTMQLSLNFAISQYLNYVIHL